MSLSSLDESARQHIVANVRRLSGVPEGQGPDNLHIWAGVRGFAEAFDYWYTRVVREAVPKYRSLIIARINPFVRRIEFDGMDCTATTWRLVEDWNSRNFVTAGGWALEEMATSSSVDAQKSSAGGIDLQRHDVSTGDYHLYVLKSGLVTRNSDIVQALKRNARQAEKLLRQGRSTGTVHAKWVVLAGKTTSTFEDGVHRPSSAAFWAEMLGLNEDDAVELALAMAAEAGRIAREDASQHLTAMKTLVGSYIASRTDPKITDWEFIAQRTMRTKPVWNGEDQARHSQALEALAATGYVIQKAIKKA